MKIAIVGGTGLLGSNLVTLYQSLHCEVQAFSRSHNTNIKKHNNHCIDFNNLTTELRAYFNTYKPDIIINAIALVNLNECEERQEYCYDTNVRIAKDLAILAKQYQSYFIQISTDHYYQDKRTVHAETDPVVLLNYYSQTKYEAEKHVLNDSTNALIVRTNIIGFRQTNTNSFFEWLLNSLKEKNPITLFNDFFTSPISVQELGKILLLCQEKRLKGIYNIASSEVINKYNFALKVAKVFNLDTDNITEGSLKSLQNSSPVMRATTLGLDIRKIEQALDITMPSIDTSIKHLLHEYKENINNEKSY